MRRPFPFVPAVLAACFLLPGAAGARTAAGDSLHYALSGPPSAFEWGCFGVCACPVSIESPLSGSFVLRRRNVGPLYTTYDVRSVRWTAPGPAGPISIAGSGTYLRGGEVADMEQLTLDLSFDGGPLQHFDSGLGIAGAPFPAIDTDISLHDEDCFDSVLVVTAKPIEATAVSAPRPTLHLAASPNPFSGATTIRLSLPRGARVVLGVYDIVGRRVRKLDASWLARGPHAIAWDGRTDRGDDATAGVYLLRLETSAGRDTRVIVKLD